MKKGQMETTFEHALIPPTSGGAKAGDVVDRNPCGAFPEPRAPGHGGKPEVFAAGVKGKNYHGKITDAATLESPMRSSKTKE
jgi:hypothetical protein